MSESGGQVTPKTADDGVRAMSEMASADVGDEGAKDGATRRPHEGDDGEPARFTPPVNFEDANGASETQSASSTARVRGPTPPSCAFRPRYACSKPQQQSHVPSAASSARQTTSTIGPKFSANPFTVISWLPSSFRGDYTTE